MPDYPNTSHSHSKCPIFIHLWLDGWWIKVRTLHVCMAVVSIFCIKHLHANIKSAIARYINICWYAFEKTMTEKKVRKREKKRKKLKHTCSKINLVRIWIYIVLNEKLVVILTIGFRLQRTAGKSYLFTWSKIVE